MQPWHNPRLSSYFEHQMARDRATQCTLTYLEGGGATVWQERFADPSSPSHFNRAPAHHAVTHPPWSESRFLKKSKTFGEQVVMRGANRESLSPISRRSPSGRCFQPPALPLLPEPGATVPLMFPGVPSVHPSSVSSSASLSVPQPPFSPACSKDLPPAKQSLSLPDVRGPRVTGGPASQPITTPGQFTGALPTVFLPRPFVFPYRRLRWRLCLYWMDSEVGASRVYDASQRQVAALELCQIVEVPQGLAAKYPECRALAGRWFRRINEALTTICTTCSRSEVAVHLRASIKEKVRADWGNCYWDREKAEEPGEGGVEGGPVAIGRGKSLNGTNGAAGDGTGERMSRYRELVSSTNQRVRKRLGCITNPKACRVGAAWYEPGSAIREECLRRCEGGGD